MRAPHSSATLRTRPRANTVLIPLQKSEGNNEFVGQNKKRQHREDVVKASKVPKTMSCGQGGAKSLARECRLMQARCAMLRCVHKCWCRRAQRVQFGDLAVGVGCMDAWPASGACGVQPQAMCALQQGWVLRARRGDAPRHQLEEVAAGRCVTSGMATLP